MPSRQPLSPPIPGNSSTIVLSSRHTTKSALLLPVAASAAVSLAALIAIAVLVICLRLRRRSPPTLPLSTSPPSIPLRRYSYRDLHRATAGFDASRRLGRGASASVYLASFPSDPTSAAVKLLSPGAPANELHVLSSLPPSPFIVALLGYSHPASSRRPLLLVFEYMSRGSLQNILFNEATDAEAGCLDWTRRFSILLDVARALAFLHLECDPPVVHGDLKPSNVLLDEGYRAKLADFGLARVKSFDADDDDDAGDPHLLSQELDPSQELSPIRKEEESQGAAAILDLPQSLNGSAKEPPLASGDDAKSSPWWGKDWWWKQDGSGELNAKDYVAEWIGRQIGTGRSPAVDDKSCKIEHDDHADEFNKEDHVDGASDKKEAATTPREWWREEFLEEMSMKSGRKSTTNKTSKSFFRSDSSGRPWHPSLDISFRKMWKRPDTGGDGGAGEMYSRDLSTTTSMRGTICYIAPECGDVSGRCMEKADIYSFGVLVLVVISGRRPLHLLQSPASLERANLVTWCRRAARGGNVLDIMDESLRGCYDKEQAAMCVNLALQCLQRLPELRPDAGEIVKILTGEMPLPARAVELSPSPRPRRPGRPTRKMGGAGGE